MSRLRLGVTLPQFTEDPEVLIDGARRAEALGLDSVWVFDHLWPLSGGKVRPILEQWSSLGYLAEATDRIGIGTLVTRSTLRNPALLAHMVDTVAEIAPGRVTVTVGSGDDLSRAENEAFGLPYLAGRERVDQLRAVVEALTARPRRPPIWVAGRGDRVPELAGALADGYNSWASTPEEFAKEAKRVRSSAGGRAVELTWAGLVVIGEDDEEATRRLRKRDPAGYLTGGPATVASRFSALAESGAGHIIATFPNAGEAGPYELLAGPVRAAMAEKP